MNAAADIKEMMTAWNVIQKAAEQKFPEATKEELYQIVKSAMQHALGQEVELMELRAENAAMRMFGWRVDGGRNRTGLTDAIAASLTEGRTSTALELVKLRADDAALRPGLDRIAEAQRMLERHVGLDKEE